MSEYQYYEFQAIDRPLDQGARDELRALSSRGRITRTSFTNEYHWGDFRGDPSELMARWFDLHLYFTNWGTRRLMMRVPRRLLDPGDLAPFLDDIDWVTVTTSGENLIVDISLYEEGGERPYLEREEDEDHGLLAALAPLRDDVLSGDLRLFYLLWLMALQFDDVPDDAIEPLSGIGPLTEPLAAFAAFFEIDGDLVAAAGESGASDTTLPKDEMRRAIAELPETDKTDLLLRLFDEDAHAFVELQRRLRARSPRTSAPRRTAGELRKRGREIEEARKRAEAERRAAEERRKAKEAEKARRARLVALKTRSPDSIWHEIETEIARRNAPGYDHAAGLLADLKALAAEGWNRSDFDKRLAGVHARHFSKPKFMERLARLGLGGDDARLV